MSITRRDLLKASAVVAGAMGITGTGLVRMREALAKEGGLPVVWLQGQGCTGCSVSLLNSIYYTTIDDLLLNTLDLEFHPNVSAAAGKSAIGAAEAAYTKGGYALVVEGAIPTADGGRACYLWPGLTALNGVRRFATKAAVVLAVGTCAAYGGMSAGRPNPTRAQSVSQALGRRTAVINIPGCPVHPDWVVGTIAYILKYGRAPALDSYGRPRDFFGTTVHARCPNRSSYTGPNYHARGRPCTQCHGAGLREDPLSPNEIPAAYLSAPGCTWPLGCKGVTTGCDCPVRKWNSPAQNVAGVNWCIGARSPCFGCTEPTFPDGMMPFYTALASAAAGGGSGGGGGGGGGTTPTPPAHANGQACTPCHDPNDPRIQGYTNPPAGGGGGTGGGGTGGGGTTPPVTPAHANGRACTSCHSANDPDIQYYTNPTGGGGTGGGGTGGGGGGGEDDDEGGDEGDGD
jgi:hydrogenase small subunit